MTNNTPVTAISKVTQDTFVEFYRSTQNNQSDIRSERRQHYERVDRSYMREMDRTEQNRRAAAANRSGDPSRTQNITVPVIMPQVEAAVTYQSSVFLTGYPIFGVVSGPQYIDQAKQMETLIHEQSRVGKWTKQLAMHFRDGFKYNFAPIEVSWQRKISYVVETDITKSKNTRCT